MYLFQVVYTSSRFFLNLYVPHPGCFLINPSSFLSWFLFPTYLGCFSSIRVLSDLVLVLAAPYRGSFLINPGCFWACLGSCRTLSGFLFLSNQVVSRLALRSVFFLISWYRCRLSHDALPSCFLFIQVISRLLWFLMYLFQVVCTSSRFFLNLYVPYPGCFLIWLSRDALPSCFYSSRSFSRLLWFLMYLFQVIFDSTGLFLDFFSSWCTSWVDY